MTKDISLADYQHVFEEAKQAIFIAQQKFLQEANQTNIGLYWQLGKLLAKNVLTIKNITFLQPYQHNWLQKRKICLSLVIF